MGTLIDSPDSNSKKKPAKYVAKVLTPKREAFCQNLFKGMSQRQAYIKAFPNVKADAEALDRMASLMYSFPIIKNRVKELQDELKERNTVTVERVLEELSHIAFDDIKNYLEFRTAKRVVGYEEGEAVSDYAQLIDLKDSNEIDTRNIQEIQLDSKGNLKFKLYPKDTALAKIGQYLGMFTDKTEITGKDGGPIEINDARKQLVERLVKKRNEGRD